MSIKFYGVGYNGTYEIFDNDHFLGTFGRAKGDTSYKFIPCCPDWYRHLKDEQIGIIKRRLYELNSDLGLI